jgi:hypothetical protein
MLERGVVIVERSEVVGAGELGRYSISSDSATEAFLDAVMRTEEPALAALRSHPTVTAMSPYIGGSVPLEMVASYLRLVGETLCDLVKNSPHGLVLRGYTALSTQRTALGGWTTRVRCERTGQERSIATQSVVLATGAHQPQSRLHSEKIAGVPLLPTYTGKVFQSAELLTKQGLEEIQDRLQQEIEPKIVVVGGSTSGGAVARVLLNDAKRLAFGKHGVTFMHRRPLRIFYNSAAEALEDGYTDFGSRDICSVTGRVYRLGGFRLETRELMMRAMRMSGRSGEPRLKLHALAEEQPSTTKKLLDEAHVIVAALGYRPRALSILAEDGGQMKLKCSCDAMRAMVDETSHVLAQDETPIAGLYGIGLASGFVPSGKLGGEESFTGQANSLWLWQHDIGAMIAAGVSADHDSRPTPAVVRPGIYRIPATARTAARLETTR